MTERTLAGDVEQSLKTEPERWSEEQMILRVVRDDGLTVWSDGQGVAEPRLVNFTPPEKKRIIAAIALWRAGPISRGEMTKPAADELPPGGTRRMPDATN